MGRRRVDAAGEPLPQMVRRYNAKNERKTMAAMAEDIWGTVESGRERRRRQACERLYGLADNQPAETAAPLAEKTVEVSEDHEEPQVAQSSSEQACTGRAQIEKANGTPVPAKSDEIADSSSTDTSERQAKDEKASVLNKRDRAVQGASGQSDGTPRQVEEEVATAHIEQPEVADAPIYPICGDEGEIDELAHLSLKQEKVDQIPGAQDCEDRVQTGQMNAPTASNECALVASTSNEKVHECREEIEVVQEDPVNEKPVQTESEPPNFTNESGAQCGQEHSTSVSSNQIDEVMVPSEAEMHAMAQHSHTNTLKEHEPKETLETMKESVECASPQVCPNGSSEEGTRLAKGEIHTGTQSPESQQTEKKTDILDLQDEQTKTTTDAKKKKREKKKGKHADNQSDFAAAEKLSQNESISRDKKGQKADCDRRHKRNKNRRKPESDTGHMRIGSTDRGEAVDAPMEVQSLSASPDRTVSEEQLLPSAGPASPGANEPLHESQQVSDASLPADGAPAVETTDRNMNKSPEMEQSHIRPQDTSSQQKATGKFNVVCDDDYLAETPTLEVVEEEWTTVETKRGKRKRKRSERKSESEQTLHADDVHESEAQAGITTSTRLSPEAPDVQITNIGISKQVIGLSTEVNSNCTDSSAPVFLSKEDANGEQAIFADKSVNDAKGHGTSSVKNAEEAEVKEGAILDAFDLLMSSGEGLSEGFMDAPARDEKIEENCAHNAVTSKRVDTSEEQLDKLPPETSRTMDAFDLLMSTEDDLNKGFMESFETKETTPIGPVVIEEKTDAELNDKLGEVTRTPPDSPTDALDLLISSGDGLQEGFMEEYEPKKQITIKQTTVMTSNTDCPDTFTTSKEHRNGDAKKGTEYEKQGSADCSPMLENKTNALDPSVPSTKDQKSGYDEASKPDQPRVSEPTELAQTTTDAFDLLMSAGEGLNEGFEESFGTVLEAAVGTARAEQTTGLSTKYYEGAKEANYAEYKPQADVIDVLISSGDDMSKGFKQSFDMTTSTTDEPSVPAETTYAPSVPADTTKSDKEPFKMVHEKDESGTDAFHLSSGVGLQEEAFPHETSEKEFSTARPKDVRDSLISCPDHGQNGLNETVGFQHECNRSPTTVESESNIIIKSDVPIISKEPLTSVQPVGSSPTTAVLSGSDIDGGISEHVDEICNAPKHQSTEHAALSVLGSEDTEQHTKEAVLTREKLYELMNLSEKTHTPNTIIDHTSGKTNKEETVNAKREAEARQSDEDLDQEMSQKERIPDNSNSDRLQGSGKSEHDLDEKLILPEMHDYASHEQTWYDAALYEAAEVRFYERMARSNSFNCKPDTKSAAVKECVVQNRESPSTVIADQLEEEKSCAEMVSHSNSELPPVAVQVQSSSKASRNTASGHLDEEGSCAGVAAHSKSELLPVTLPAQSSSEASRTGVTDHINEEEPCATRSPQSNSELLNVASQALPTSEASPPAVPVSHSNTWFDKALYATAEAQHYETLTQKCSGDSGSGSSRNSSSGSFPVYEGSCDHFTAEDDQATDDEFAPCENAVPQNDSLWVESKIYNVTDAIHREHSSPEVQPESTELAPSADSPHPVAPTQINAAGTTNSEITVVTDPLESAPSELLQSLDGVRSPSSAANSAASPLSPLSPQHEPDDVYFEDVVLAGRQSDVTMAALRGFTASPLSEGLAPGEQLDSLRTEPDLELSEPGTADILEDGDEAAQPFFYGSTEGAETAMTVVEEAQQERPPPVLAERLSTPELKTEIPTPGLAEGLQSPKLDDGLPSPELKTDIPAVALSTGLPSPTLAGGIPLSTIGTGIGVPDITTDIPPVSLTAGISELAVTSEILTPAEVHQSTTVPMQDAEETFKPVQATIASSPVKVIKAPEPVQAIAAPPPVQAIKAAEPVQAIAAPPPVEAIKAAAPVQAIAAPPPVQAIKASEPVQAIAAPPPVEAIKAAEPVQAIAAPPPVQAIKASEPVQAIAAPPPVEAIQAAEPVQAIAASPPVEAIKAAAPVQAIAAPPPVEAIKASEPVQAIAAPPPVQAIKASEPVQAIAAPPPVEAIKAAEPVQDIAAPPPVEAIKAAEPVQAIATPPPVEAIQAAEPVQAIAASPPVEAIKAAEPVQDIAAPPPVEAIKASKPVQAIAAPPPVEAIQAAEPVQAIAASPPVEAIKAAAPVQAIAAPPPVEAIKAAEPVQAIATPPPVEAIQAAEPVQAIAAPPPVEAMNAAAPVIVIKPATPVQTIMASTLNQATEASIATTGTTAALSPDSDCLDPISTSTAIESNERPAQGIEEQKLEPTIWHKSGKENNTDLERQRKESKESKMQVTGMNPSDTQAKEVNEKLGLADYGRVSPKESDEEIISFTGQSTPRSPIITKKINRKKKTKSGSTKSNATVLEKKPAIEEPSSAKDDSVIPKASTSRTCATTAPSTIESIATTSPPTGDTPAGTSASVVLVTVTTPASDASVETRGNEAATSAAVDSVPTASEATPSGRLETRPAGRLAMPSHPILADRTLFLPGDEGRTYASLMQQGADMLPARPVFHAHACHVCKRLHTKQHRLKSCGSCRLVAYCSAEHQRAHWPLHRALCRVITRRLRHLGTQHLYREALNVSAPQQWKRIRFKHMAVCEEMLDRPMEPYEKEMFLYPRACDTCHETSPERLRTCTACHSVSFCCDAHLRKTHAKFCKDLRLLLDIHSHQNVHGVCAPPLPDTVLAEYATLPPHIREFLVVSMLGPQRALQMGAVELAVLSECASYPLTLLYALQNIPVAEEAHVSRLERLTVHVVGAEFAAECEPIARWDVFLLNVLPRLRRLHVVFVGAELEVADGRPGVTEQDFTCRPCLAAGKRFTCEFQPNTAYHTYCRSPQFRPPHVVCAFNAGLHRHAGHESRDTWRDSLPHLVRDGVPLVLTGYTLLECPQDVARVQQEQRVDVLLPPMKNPYRSTRPLQNFLNEHEAPLVFKNQYVACLMAAGKARK